MARNDAPFHEVTRLLLRDIVSVSFVLLLLCLLDEILILVLLLASVVFANIEDSGVDGSTAYLRAHIETMLNDYALVNDGTPIDLCGNEENEEDNTDDYSYATDDAVYNTAYDNYVNAYGANDDDGTDDVYTYNVEEAYFHVDDAYFNTNEVNDADECPQDGVYKFETEFIIPSLGRMWRATGWKANADVKLAAGGSVIGSCALVFETKAFGMSARRFFTIFASVMSVTLFVGIFLAIRRGNGYGVKDDAKDFHQMGDDLCEAAADVATTPCKGGVEDLETTFGSDSTPSLCENEESIGTSFGTSFGTPENTRTTKGGTRPSPITVRDLMNARQCRLSPPSPPSPEVGVEDAFQYQFQDNPPSPIKQDDAESLQSGPPPDPPSCYPTPPRDDSYRYSPPRRMV